MEKAKTRPEGGKYVVGIGEYNHKHSRGKRGILAFSLFPCTFCPQHYLHKKTRNCSRAKTKIHKMSKNRKIMNDMLYLARSILGKISSDLCKVTKEETNCLWPPLSLLEKWANPVTNHWKIVKMANPVTNHSKQLAKGQIK